MAAHKPGDVLRFPIVDASTVLIQPAKRWSISAKALTLQHVCHGKMAPVYFGRPFIGSDAASYQGYKLVGAVHTIESGDDGCSVWAIGEWTTDFDDDGMAPFWAADMSTPDRAELVEFYWQREPALPGFDLGLLDHAVVPARLDQVWAERMTRALAECDPCQFEGVHDNLEEYGCDLCGNHWLHPDGATHRDGHADGCAWIDACDWAENNPTPTD